jgi:hypothetical protein
MGKYSVLAEKRYSEINELCMGILIKPKRIWAKNKTLYSIVVPLLKEYRSNPSIDLYSQINDLKPEPETNKTTRAELMDKITSLCQLYDIRSPGLYHKKNDFMQVVLDNIEKNKEKTVMMSIELTQIWSRISRSKRQELVNIKNYHEYTEKELFSILVN